MSTILNKVLICVSIGYLILYILFIIEQSCKRFINLINPFKEWFIKSFIIFPLSTALFHIAWHAWLLLSDSNISLFL